MTVCLENRLWRCLKRGYNYRATGNKRPGVPIDTVRNWFKTYHIIGRDMFPASPRSPNRPLSRMGCGGDYRFQSRGRTAVGFYHPAGRPTASPAGIFMPNCRSVLSVCSGVYRRARGCSGDRIVMRTPSEKTKTHPMA